MTTVVTSVAVGTPSGELCSTTLLGLSVNVETTAFTVSAVGSLPLTDQLSLYAQAGVAFWEVTGSAPGLTVDVSEDGNDIQVGLGANFYFTEMVGVRGAWDRLDVEGDPLDFLSINVLVAF